MSVGSFIENLMQRNQQISDGAKSADYFAKANPDFLDKLGMDKTAWANLSAQDKAQAAHGYITSNAVLQFQSQQQTEKQRQQIMQQSIDSFPQQQEMNAANLEHLRQQTAEAQSQTGAENAFDLAQRKTSGQPVLDAINQGQGPINDIKQPTLADLLRNIVTTPGAARSRAGSGLLERALMEQGQTSKIPPTIGFNEDPVTGTRFATFGNSMTPSGVNPQKLGSDALPILDGQNVVGYRFNTPKGPQLHWLPQSGYPADATIQTENGVNVVKDANGRILKTIGQSNPFGIMLQGLTGGTGTTGAGASVAPAAPASRPASAAQPNVTQEQYGRLKKGEKYWWNGQQIPKQ